METVMSILLPVLFLAGIGLVLGLALAFASKKFAVKADERIEKIVDCLPGANCGGCGYAGCAALATAITEGNAKVNACTVGGEVIANDIAEIMGVVPEKTVRMRAQVMCSGTYEFAKKKYAYEGAHDCLAAVRLGGGDKLCPNGCIGLGTCVKGCKFDAIRIIDGVAAIDYEKCSGCGVCTVTCPKHIIKLIPYDSRRWVGCSSTDKGSFTRKYCELGCIGCKLCEKACPAGAIKVENFVASIDYSKCTDCDKCTDVCTRKIIWSDSQQDKLGLTIDRYEL